MIYLQSNTILATICVLPTKTKEVYLLGDTIYQALPNQVLKNAFLGANWNRALKYGQGFFANQVEQLTNEYGWEQNFVPKIGYYKFSFDLYYDEVEQVLKVLTKNSFDQQIVNQQNFPTFLNTVISQTNKFKQNYHLQINDRLWTEQLINFNQTNQLPVNNFTHFVVSKNFVLPTTKVRYKYLICEGEETKFEITQHQQVIYTYDSSKISTLKNQFSYLDLRTNTIYLNGILKTKNQADLFLDLNYEDSQQVETLKQAIFDQFENYFANEKTSLIHFFNLTGDINYLIAELNQNPNWSYYQILTSLNLKFDQTKSNHYPLIYQETKLRQILFSRIKTQAELNDFSHQTNRFAILSKDEVLAVEKKFQKLK